MKGYILGITGIAMLSAVISMISPSKKTGKAIDGVLKLCMVAAILLPLAEVFRQTSGNFFSETSITTENTAYINNSYALAVERYVKEEFAVTVRVEYGEDKITVYVIDAEEEEFSELSEKIKQGVSALCNTETEVVYEGD
jgi:hypothetical protein